MDNWNPDEVKKIVANPYYCLHNPQIISREDFIKAGVLLIAGDWCRGVSLCLAREPRGTVMNHDRLITVVTLVYTLAVIAWTLAAYALFGGGR